MKVLSIVGARPEFVQAWPISRVLRERHTEVLVHTGQHYDYEMSQSFFEQLGLPTPEHSLGIGSGTHGWQTGRMLEQLESVIASELPDVVVVRGDTNSTLAGALAASKLGVPFAHVEAGERSYVRTEPEEVNRLVTDRLADLHLCASRTAMKRLAAEGIVDSVYWVGDVMLDALRLSTTVVDERAEILAQLELTPGGYTLVTVHRAANTDDLGRLSALVNTLNSFDDTIVFPVHPRCRAALDRAGLTLGPHIKDLPPLSYLDMLALVRSARLVATDSGGIQREAFCLGVRCMTFREATEWVETLDDGWNTLVGVDVDHIRAHWWRHTPSANQLPIFGDGRAAHRIVHLLEQMSSGQLRTLREDSTQIGSAHTANPELERSSYV